MTGALGQFPAADLMPLALAHAQAPGEVRRVGGTGVDDLFVDGAHCGPV